MPQSEQRDSVYYFVDLRDAVGAWSQHNFGDQLPHRPAMGMVEELTELTLALDQNQEEVLDAIGDTVIYMADYFYRRGWDLGWAWENRQRLGMSGSARVFFLIGKLCHSHLKGEQNIRGGSEKHDMHMRQGCADVLAYLEDICNLQGWKICDVVQTVWAVVGKRDWKKNPNDAHAIAAGFAGVTDVPPTPDRVPVEFCYPIPGLPPEVAAISMNLEGVTKLELSSTVVVTDSVKARIITTKDDLRDTIPSPPPLAYEVGDEVHE